MFVGTLQVALVSESHGDALAMWVTLAPFGYTSPSTGVAVTIPSGFTTDFCSVPRIPGAFDYLGDIANQAGVIHDWLYGSGELSRMDADNMLREMVVELGYGHDKAELIYTGVRIFGEPHYTAAPAATLAAAVVAAAQTATPPTAPVVVVIPQQEAVPVPP